MGARSAAETVSHVLAAFLRQRTWQQAELARVLEVSPRTIRNTINALTRAGVPFEHDPDPPHVYWSVPRTWFPTGTMLTTDQLREVCRLLARLPASAARERALLDLLAAVPDAAGAANTHAARVPDPALEVLEDAWRHRQPVRMRYTSASRGDTDERTVSVHHIDYGPQVRFVAICHRARKLRWFRAEDVHHAAIDGGAAHLPVERDDLAEYLATSAAGFRADGPAVECRIFVRDPDWRWIKRNLPSAPSSTEPVPGGMVFGWRTAAVEPLARWVVGLGAAARVETPDLAAAVRDLAAGALSSLDGTFPAQD